MGLWENLFGQSEEDSLEARIGERRNQAKEREITKKALRLTIGLWNREREILGLWKKYYPSGEFKKKYSCFIVEDYDDGKLKIHATREKKCSKDYDYSDCENGIFEYSSTHWIGFEVEIYFQSSLVYQDKGRDVSYSSSGRKKKPDEKYNGTRGISTYIPGEWEAHLERIYRIVSDYEKEQEKDRIKLRDERNANAESERKYRMRDDRRRCFGL